MAIYNLKASLVKVVVLLVAVNLINPTASQAAGRSTTAVANTIRSAVVCLLQQLELMEIFILI
jgi:hypothetical protein